MASRHIRLKQLQRNLEARSFSLITRGSAKVVSTHSECMLTYRPRVQ